MFEKFSSRKFLVTIGGCLTALGFVLQGALSPEQGVSAVVTLVLAYVGIEGAGDLVSRWVERYWDWTVDEDDDEPA